MQTDEFAHVHRLTNTGRKRDASEDHQARRSSVLLTCIRSFRARSLGPQPDYGTRWVVTNSSVPPQRPAYLANIAAGVLGRDRFERIVVKQSLRLEGS